MKILLTYIILLLGACFIQSFAQTNQSVESAKLKDSLTVNRNYRIVDTAGNNYKLQQIPGPDVIAEPFNLNSPFCNEFERNYPKWKDTTIETFKK